MGTTQKKNAELIRLLAGTFQRRYEPNFAHGNAISHYQSLSGLRAFWPMSGFDNAGNANDLSGVAPGRAILVGSPVFNYDGLAPYCKYDGANDYHRRPDAALYDIIGDEAFIHPAAQGLTIGVLFQQDITPPATNEGLIGKWNDNAVNQRSYLLYIDTNGKLIFSVSEDGTAVVSTPAAAFSAISASTWYFAAGRLNAGVEVKAWLDDDTAINAVGIPATVFNSNADVNIAAYDNGLASTRFDGEISFAFICATALSDAHLFILYEQTRAMFGV